jgi:hypothetical protein
MMMAQNSETLITSSAWSTAYNFSAIHISTLFILQFILSSKRRRKHVQLLADYGLCGERGVFFMCRVVLRLRERNEVITSTIAASQGTSMLSRFSSIDFLMVNLWLAMAFLSLTIHMPPFFPCTVAGSGILVAKHFCSTVYKGEAQQGNLYLAVAFPINRCIYNL